MLDDIVRALDLPVVIDLNFVVVFGEMAFIASHKASHQRKALPS